LLTLNEDGKVSFWNDENLVEQLDLIDDDIKTKLGTESLQIKPKSFAYNNGILIVGLEQNIIIKYNLDENFVSVIIFIISIFYRGKY
jgi:predicted alpha-1,6-mannanase (GH76 family)